MPAVSGPPTAVLPVQKRGTPAPSTASVASSVPLAAGAVPPPPTPDDAPPLLRERRSRRKLLALILVIVLAAGIGGAVAWYVNRDQSNAVPDLAGLEVGAALNEISEFGWETSQTTEPSDDVDEGVVIRTNPAPGVRLDRGDDFALVVSSGPAPRVLPEIVGMTIPDATAALEQLGLVLQEGERINDEELEAGSIVSWVVPAQPGLAAGGTALPGTIIVATTSAGPAARDVPDLTGLALADATTQLEALGLVVVRIEDEFSPDVPVGAIARQNPAVGSKVAKGSTIELALSKGPDLVPVPALAELTVDQATAALEAAGLTIGEVKGDPAGFAVLAEFDGQALTASSTLPRGSAVDVTFEVPPPPTTTTPPTTVPPETTTPPTSAPTG
jgi:serine/threonine-protein kinase